MNKNVKKQSSNTYSPEDKGKRMESKLKEKKDVTRTNKMYNKVLKDFDLDNLDDYEDVEFGLLEHKYKKGK